MLRPHQGRVASRVDSDPDAAGQKRASDHFSRLSFTQEIRPEAASLPAANGTAMHVRQANGTRHRCSVTAAAMTSRATGSPPGGGGLPGICAMKLRVAIDPHLPDPQLLPSKCNRRVRDGAITAASTNRDQGPTSCPPSTTMVWAVTQLALSEARKSTTSATSSGLPIRPKGMLANVA